jgi:hypothetical protein
MRKTVLLLATLAIFTIQSRGQETILGSIDGWNLFIYEITEILTDEGGKTYPVKESHTSISEAPSDLQYVFLPE